MCKTTVSKGLSLVKQKC